MLKIRLTDIVIIVLILILFLQKCGKDTPHIVEVPKIVRDTVWVFKDSVVYSKPKIINSEPYIVPVDQWNTEYIPDTNYPKLMRQYEMVVRELLAKNIHTDSVKIDSIGHIYITDTVSKNMITGRNTHYNLHYPVITNTITLPTPKKTQWYIGGNVQGSKTQLVNQINAGIMIKNKKDGIFGAYIGINDSKALQFGLQSYWKIKIK